MLKPLDDSSMELPALRYAIGLGISCLTASALIFEIALTKIFSVIAWYHHTPMIISIALLGFGAAGSYLGSKGQTISREALMRRLAQLSRAYAATTVISLVVVARTQFYPLMDSLFNEFLSLSIFYAVLIGPFFLCGLCLGLLLSAFPRQATWVYGFDLTGAGLGSLVAIMSIAGNGATATVLLVAAFAALGALLFSLHSDRDAKVASSIVLVLVLAVFGTFVFSEPLRIYAPPSKELYQFLRPWNKFEDSLLVSRWGNIARIDLTRTFVASLSIGALGVVGTPYQETQWQTRMIFQDGSAPSAVLKVDRDVRQMDMLEGLMASAPYHVKKNPNVLVIGVGGGTDILIALHNGAARIEGVEINPVTVDLLRDELTDFTGGLFRRPEVHITCQEGRNFAATTQNSYDVIQLTGVDTFTALATGAYTLTENYLYTVEAIQQFWDRLAEDGILSYSRWLFRPPRETLRLCSVEMEALRRLGVHEPSKHILIVGRDRSADTMLKKTPFTREEVGMLRAWASRMGFLLLYDPFAPPANEFTRLIQSDEASREAFYSTYPYDVRPVTDDSPFFFQYYRWKDSLFPGRRPTIEEYQYPEQFPIGLRNILLSLAQATILSLLFILYPLRRLPRSAGRSRSSFWLMVYFACLGLGFIFVEMILMQKFTVFLGGPTYSLAVTLASLLMFSGVGSFLSRRGAARPYHWIRIIIPAIVVLGFCYVGFFRWAIPRLLGLPDLTRIAIGVFAMAPIGLVMGMPFPLGIQRVARASPFMIPWAWGTNACFTVVGSNLCVLLCMLLGFTKVMVLSLGIYSIGLLSLSFVRGEPDLAASDGTQSPCTH